MKFGDAIEELASVLVIVLFVLMVFVPASRSVLKLMSNSSEESSVDTAELIEFNRDYAQRQSHMESAQIIEQEEARRADEKIRREDEEAAAIRQMINEKLAKWYHTPEWEEAVEETPLALQPD